MGPNPNGPYQVSCDRAKKILRFFRGPWTVGPTVGDFLDCFHGLLGVQSLDINNARVLRCRGELWDLSWNKVMVPPSASC